MKKVWIASILACIMLLVPLNSVIGVSDSIEDCDCNPVRNLNVERVERLLNRLESRINFILLRYGHIPEVVEKCHEALELINSDSFIDMVCNIVWYLLLFIGDLLENISGILFLLFALPAIILMVFWNTYCY